MTQQEFDEKHRGAARFKRTAGPFDEKVQLVITEMTNKYKFGRVKQDFIRAFTNKCQRFNLAGNFNDNLSSFIIEITREFSFQDFGDINSVYMFIASKITKHLEPFSKPLVFTKSSKKKRRRKPRPPSPAPVRRPSPSPPPRPPAKSYAKSYGRSSRKPPPKPPAPPSAPAMTIYHRIGVPTAVTYLSYDRPMTYSEQMLFA